jgi:hypothetical protein
MLSYVNISVALLAFALIGFSLKAVFEFRSYCGAVAKAQGRTAEFETVYGTDENTLNSYEREQFRQLMKEDFENLDDKQLVVRGRRLATRLKLLRMLTIMFVVVVGIIYVGSEFRIG